MRKFIQNLKRFLLRLPATGERGSALKRWAVAIFCVSAAFAVRLALHPLLDSESFVLFVPAVITIAWYCGLISAVIATVVTLVLSNYFLISPTGHFTQPDSYQVVSALVYIFSALFVVGLTSLLRTEQQRVATKAKESQERADLLQAEMEHRRRVEERLREREGLLNGFLENSPAVVFLKNLEGRYLVSNREFEKMIGRPASEIHGKSDNELFSPEQAAIFLSSDFQVLESGLPMQFEEVLSHEGELHTAITHKFPLRDENGEIYALGGIAVDITERKRVEEALKANEERYRSLYTNTPVMMHSIDANGQIVSVSQMWLTCMGYKLEEVIGCKSTDFLTPESQRRATLVLQQYFKDGFCTDVPYQMRKKNGEIMDVLLSATAERDDAGNIKCSLAVIIDVTAQKRAEKALRDSEMKLRILAETAASGIISSDSEGTITQINRSAERMFGYSPSELLGKSIFPLVPKRFEDMCRHEFYRLGSPEQQPFLGQITELVGLRKDGTEFPLELALSSWEVAERKFFTGILIDITERKQAEEALRRSEELLRITTEGASVDLWSWDIINDRLECPMEKKIEESLHDNPDDAEIKLHTFLQHVHPDDRLWVNQQVANCLRDHTDFNAEYRLLMPDGSVHWRHSKGRPTYSGNRPVRMSGMSMDITARKEAEEALRRNEELLRMTTESADIGLWSWNIETDHLELNLVESEQYGLPLGTELTMQKLLDCIHPEDRERLNGEMKTCLREGRELDLEHRILHPDGRIRWSQCRGRASYISGRPVRVSGMSLDITERKRVEEALHRQAELLNLAQVVGFDLENKIIFWNRGAEKLYGWTEQEAMGQDTHTLLRTEFPEPIQRIKEKLFADGHWEGELVHYRKNNEKITVASVWAIYKDPQNRAVAILESNNNITELKKTQAELKEARDMIAAHAEQLEQSVARRTAQLHASLKDMEVFCYSIAHDLRAPLRAMSGFSQSLEQDYGKHLDETGHDYCQRINTAANRMNQLISDLLVYGRLTHIELPANAVDLTEEVEKVIERSSSQLEQSHAEIEVQKPLPHVCADALVLDQVIENLLTNAVKFVPPERRPHIRIYAEHSRDTVRLCVEDNGIGILPEHRQRIFKPFERLHTTAYPGTGIGLAIVQRGVEKMGGRVGVESSMGQGSRFWVELPEHCANSKA